MTNNTDANYPNIHPEIELIEKIEKLSLSNELHLKQKGICCTLLNNHDFEHSQHHRIIIQDQHLIIELAANPEKLEKEIQRLIIIINSIFNK